MKSHRGELTMRTVVLPLLLAERARSQSELAKEFDVDNKTIKRTIDELSRFYPVVEERAGREIVYRFRDGYQYRPPTFSPLELATLLLAQESIASAGLTSFGSPLNTHARTLLLKVRNALPPSLRDKLDTLATIFGSAAVPAKDFRAHASLVDQLTDAAIECRRVLIRYHSLTRDSISERIVEPLAIYFDPDGATLKLIAFDHRRKMIVPFSIDRISNITETKESFNRPLGFNLQDFLKENCFNGIHGQQIDVRLRAFGVTARIFAERIFHPSQRIIETTPSTAGKSETTIIEMRVARGRGLVRFVLSWSPDVEVLEPAELRLEVADALERSLARYAEPEK
jgi:predicted DNA-binding transcriptional regulator YafY